MGRWWDTDMASSSQAMYTDPELALQAASTPDDVFQGGGFAQNVLNYTAAQKEQDEQEVKQNRNGFLNSVFGWFSDVDKEYSGNLLYDMTKGYFKAMWYPVDKAASAAHWLYSEVVSQPLSTLWIQGGKTLMREDIGVFFSGDEWSQAYGEAETQSVGQSISNVLNTVGTGAYLETINPEVADTYRRKYERLVYDTDYWRDKAGWRYTAGSGAVDALAVISLDPTTYVTGGAGQVIKGVRSARFIEKGGELVRTRGAIADTARKAVGKKPETIEDFSQSKKMNEFYDWIMQPSKTTNAPRKTVAEIEAHPIWGRGRRTNDFKHQYSQVFSQWDRADFPLAFRFSMGDNAAAAELAARGGKVLDDLGRLNENRVLVNSTRLDPELTAMFQRGGSVPFGPMTAEAALAEEAAKGAGKIAPITAAKPLDQAAAESWKASKLELINSEVDRLTTQSEMLAKLLGPNLGRAAEEFSTVGTGFGGLDRAYRMGSGSFSNVSASAERRFLNKMKDRRGRFSTDGYRKGFYGTPLRIVQSFGDKTPHGRINHNDSDAGDRVFEMLREVPGLGPEVRSGMLNTYMTAGDKIAKSKVLESINEQVILHLAQRVHGLDGEVARAISTMVQGESYKTIQKLLGTTGRRVQPKGQAFSGALRDEALGATKANRVDYVDDGVGYVMAPLAKTQLSQTDTLLPIRELNRVFARNSGAMQQLRKSGGSAKDVALMVSDNFSTVWKAATLLRPAYVPRMISEEAALSALKFGFLSRIVGDGSRGAKNFVLNRAQYVGAELGLTSYTPSTGKGVESAFSVVKIGDEDVVQAVKSRRESLKKEIARESDPLKRKTLEGELSATKYSRIRVNRALPVVRARIQMEREMADDLRSEVAELTRRRDAITANLNAPPKLGAGPGSASAVRSANRRSALEDQIAALNARIDDHNNVLGEFTDYANEILRTAVASTGRRLGEGSFEAFGYRIPQAFSGEWQNSIPRDQISQDTNAAMGALYARQEAVDTARFIKTGSWDTIEAGAPNHMESWLHALNRQFVQDDVFYRVLQDSSGKTALEWLKTPAGRNHLRDMGIRGRDPQKLVDDITITLDKYLPEDTGLRAKLVDGEEITAADLESAIAKADFPTVHGEEIAEKIGLTAKHSGANVLDRMIQKGFERMGSIPSDVMSRHPVYLRFQEGRYKEILGRELSYRRSVGREEALTPDQLEKILHESDRLARKDMSKIVYDPQRTTASEALRFIAPFFSAHADSLARWGGMIAEKPELVGKLARIYNAPVSAGLITDTSGNPVGKDGYVDVRDPVTGKIVERKFVGIDERVMHFRAPWADKNQGSFPVKIQALNTILPGDPWFNPGAGPMVQVAGSQIAKTSPQAGDFLQWSKILPYGPSGSAVEAVTPKYMRTLWDAYKGDDPDNEEYQKAYLAIWNKKVMEYHTAAAQAAATGSEIPEHVKFSQKDIEREAKEFLFLNVLEAWGSPAQSSNSPLTGTPYQFYVDQLNQLKKIDPETANDKFLAKYGTDFAGFTASLSKSMGIASTISADSMAEKYQDEIAADPDMAQFWVGNVYNGGPFSSSVYQKQLDENYGARMAREKITAEEAIENTQSEQGWREYRAGKMLLDSYLIQNGFKSYSQKGAEDFNEARKQLVASLSQRFPAWENAFNVVDRGKVPQRIEFFTKAIQDDRLMNDPMRHDLKVLPQYLAGRQIFKQMLAERGLSKVSYNAAGEPIGESADIAEAWNQFKMSLINSNVAFNELHNRYLSNDDLQ